MYFQKFPQLFYDIKGNGELSIFTHIMKRVKLNAGAAANTKIFDFFQVTGGDKPEDVAFKYYGDAQLHWVVLLVNDITDRYHQWPMTVPQFEAYIADKYTNPDGIHHYTIPKQSGDTTEVINIGTDNTSHPTATTVSNRQFELDLQTEYSKIRLIHSDFINQFITEFEDLMNEGTSI